MPVPFKNSRALIVCSRLFASYIIPTPVIEHFLKDITRNGRYQGFCSMGMIVQVASLYMYMCLLSVDYTSKAVSSGFV